jgi:hypothetical protein
VFVKHVDNDRDRGMDRLLAEALRARAADAPSDACLDADTAAAWAEAGLSASARSTVEAHAASCARCQALLAALVRITPARTASRWFRVPRMAWVAPLTAAAATALIWALLPPRAPIAPGPPMASADSAVVAPASAPPALHDAPPPAPATPAPLAAAARPPTPAAPRALSAAPPLRADAVAPPSALVLPEAAAKTAGTRASREPSSAAPEKASPPPVASVQESVRITSAADATMARSGNTVGRQRLVAGPDAGRRWIIGVNGAIQHSADGGATWETQRTGATVTLAAGASPSPLVCWLVGPGGIVVLSTDARSWQTLLFPEAIDLVSVDATDDRRATVAAADGRKFSTADRGVTWTRRDP